VDLQTLMDFPQSIPILRWIQFFLYSLIESPSKLFEYLTVGLTHLARVCSLSNIEDIALSVGGRRAERWRGRENTEEEKGRSDYKRSIICI
jgi:hypothetical protein